METKQLYALLDEDGYIKQCTRFSVEDDGPPPPFYPPGDWRLIDAVPDWNEQETSTCKLRWMEDGQHVWEETADLTDLRAKKRLTIDGWKLEANSSYFEFAGERIAYKESDRIEIQAVHNWVALTGTMPDWPDWPGAWKAISNRWVPLPDVEAWTAFTLAIGQRGTAHFKRAQLLKGAVTAAQTSAELNAITWLEETNA